jgi:hypothetical protein
VCVCTLSVCVCVCALSVCVCVCTRVDELHPVVDRMYDKVCVCVAGKGGWGGGG